MIERIKITENFYLDEFFDKKTYMKYAKAGILWKLLLKLDMSLIEGLQILRTMLGVPFTINNWYYIDYLKGKETRREWSGFRPAGTPYWSENSMHSLCKAIDFVCSKDAEEVRKFIEANWKVLRGYFTRTEKGTTWVHIDRGFVLDNSKLIYVNPS